MSAWNPIPRAPIFIGQGGIMLFEDGRFMIEESILGQEEDLPGRSFARGYAAKQKGVGKPLILRLTEGLIVSYSFKDGTWSEKAEEATAASKVPEPPPLARLPDQVTQLPELATGIQEDIPLDSSADPPSPEQIIIRDRLREAKERFKQTRELIKREEKALFDLMDEEEKALYLNEEDKAWFEQVNVSEAQDLVAQANKRSGEKDTNQKPQAPPPPKNVPPIPPTPSPPAAASENWTASAFVLGSKLGIDLLPDGHYQFGNYTMDQATSLTNCETGGLKIEKRAGPGKPIVLSGGGLFTGLLFAEGNWWGYGPAPTPPDPDGKGFSPPPVSYSKPSAPEPDQTPSPHQPPSTPSSQKTTVPSTPTEKTWPPPWFPNPGRVHGARALLPTAHLFVVFSFLFFVPWPGAPITKNLWLPYPFIEFGMLLFGVACLVFLLLHRSHVSAWKAFINRGNRSAIPSLGSSPGQCADFLSKLPLSPGELNFSHSAGCDNYSKAPVAPDAGAVFTVIFLRHMANFFPDLILGRQVYTSELGRTLGVSVHQRWEDASRASCMILTTTTGNVLTFSVWKTKFPRPRFRPMYSFNFFLFVFGLAALYYFAYWSEFSALEQLWNISALYVNYVAPFICARIGWILFQRRHDDPALDLRNWSDVHSGTVLMEAFFNAADRSAQAALG